MILIHLFWIFLLRRIWDVIIKGVWVVPLIILKLWWINNNSLRNFSSFSSFCTNLETCLIKFFYSIIDWDMWILGNWFLIERKDKIDRDVSLEHLLMVRFALLFVSCGDALCHSIENVLFLAFVRFLKNWLIMFREEAIFDCFI